MNLTNQNVLAKSIFGTPIRLGKAPLGSRMRTSTIPSTVPLGIELGSYTFPEADESDDYEGFDGPSLEGQAVQKILFTFQTNYTDADNTCMSIAEISFEVPEDPESTLVHIIKRNAPDFALDGDATDQEVYLWSADMDNVNQQWLEIDRGDGYYSYQKYDTDFCMDAGSSGAIGQDVYLDYCVDNDQNQHWQKVDVGDDAFKLVKRNASGFAAGAGEGGADGQNVSLYNAADTDEDLHWIITLVEDPSEEVDIEIENAAFTIFPNPAVNEISLQGVTDGEVNIYTLSGKLLLSKSSDSNTEILDVSRLTAGVYIITLQTETEMIVRKLVKQ